MRQEIVNIQAQAMSQIMECKSISELENLRSHYLGKKGKINELIQHLKSLPSEEKREAGVLLNQTKETISKNINSRLIEIRGQKSNEDWVDLTIPGKEPEIGTLHPQTTVLKEIKDIFNYLGYQITDGPEIETDYYNFKGLNFADDHPARDTQQSLHIDTKGTKAQPGEVILRTQTSAMQPRVMEKSKPPFRVLVPGKNYRYDQVDVSHDFEFWQVEGFVVDKDIYLTDLFGTIEYVLKSLFGEKAKIRFATTNFPFVEPGVDTYLGCTICDGKGCAFCKGTGWSEIMPAGMIHPNVLRDSGIDPEKWRGFAFAIGLSRVVNLRYQIHDLRTLTTPDTRILKQFKKL